MPGILQRACRRGARARSPARRKRGAALAAAERRPARARRSGRPWLARRSPLRTRAWRIGWLTPRPRGRSGSASARRCARGGRRQTGRPLTRATAAAPHRGPGGGGGRGGGAGAAPPLRFVAAWEPKAAGAAGAAPAAAIPTSEWVEATTPLLATLPVREVYMLLKVPPRRGATLTLPSTVPSPQRRARSAPPARSLPAQARPQRARCRRTAPRLGARRTPARPRV